MPSTIGSGGHIVFGPEFVRGMRRSTKREGTIRPVRGDAMRKACFRLAIAARRRDKEAKNRASYCAMAQGKWA